MHVKPKTSFSLSRRVPDWEVTSCVLRERIFRCDRRVYLWVRTKTMKEIVYCHFKHHMLARIKAPKKPRKRIIHRNPSFVATLMSGFSNLRGRCCISKESQKYFFWAPSANIKCPIISRFLLESGWQTERERDKAFERERHRQKGLRESVRVRACVCVWAREQEMMMIAFIITLGKIM